MYLIWYHKLLLPPFWRGNYGRVVVIGVSVDVNKVASGMVSMGEEMSDIIFFVSCDCRARSFVCLEKKVMSDINVEFCMVLRTDWQAMTDIFWPWDFLKRIFGTSHRIGISCKPCKPCCGIIKERLSYNFAWLDIDWKGLWTVLQSRKGGKVPRWFLPRDKLSLIDKR